MFIAHIRSEDGAQQLLDSHLTETAAVASNYGGAANLKKNAFLAGLLHDCGKYSDAFQEYLRLAVTTPASTVRGSVDHSSYGGQLLNELPETIYEKLAVKMIANAIFAHHSGQGLLDYIAVEQGEFNFPFATRMNKDLPEYEQVKTRFYSEVISRADLKAALKESGQEVEKAWKKCSGNGTRLFFLTKFIYSCLLDGDRTNTYRFETDAASEHFDIQAYYQTCQQNLEKKIASFSDKPQTAITALREQMSADCLNAAIRPTDIYRLSIPTGGGKTFSSLRFALAHALKYKKKRIIYIIPFNTILEQNVEEVRQATQDFEHILEHHSNSSFLKNNGKEVDQNSEELEKKQALLQDNWEAPIIFTTMVRFLETAFAGSTRNPRRFHQLLESVIIFDEVQAIPPNCIGLFNRLLEFLKVMGNTTSLLCTATQPALEEAAVRLQVPPENEIIPNLPLVYKAFKRTKVCPLVKDEGWQLDDIVELAADVLATKRNLLLILNTKNAVKNVYDKLSELVEIPCYHLSTNMCGAHRQEILTEIKNRLKQALPLICVTTPLIEAGVDISFESVIRSTTGMDSIAQAAGRCNRHGEAETPQPVYIINPVKSLENVDGLEQVKIGKEITERFIRNAKYSQQELDLLAPMTLRAYFTTYYQIIDKQVGYPIKNPAVLLISLMDQNKNWLTGYEQSKGEQFQDLIPQSPATIAKNFHVITDQTKSIVVPYGRGSELIGLLNSDKTLSERIPLLKEAQRYSINLYEQTFRYLGENQLLHPLLDGIGYSLAESAYDKVFGLNSEGSSAMTFLGY